MRARDWDGDIVGATFVKARSPPSCRGAPSGARDDDRGDRRARRRIDAASVCAVSELPPERSTRRSAASPSPAGVPVLVGAAFRNQGIHNLLDAVVDYLPSPIDIPPVLGLDADGHEVARKASSEASRSRRSPSES